MNAMPTILLIDDDPDFVEATCTVLESVPYEVLVAYNGDEGLTRAQEARPDLIILDVIMPGKDGFQVFEKLKADPALAHIPIMVLTSLSNGLSLAPTSRGPSSRGTIPAEDYINKPIRPADLLRRVTNLLDETRNTHPTRYASGTRDTQYD